MAEYQSVFDGPQIDEGIGKIINGAVDKAVLDAQAAATSAQADAIKTAADRLVVEGAGDAERGRVTAEKKRVAAEKARATAEADRGDGEKARDVAESVRKSAEDGRIERDAADSLCEPYNPLRDYVTGNKAVQNGSTYRCTAPCRGIAPPDSAKWLLVAAKGLDGHGSGDMLAGTYDPTGKRMDIFAFAETKKTDAIAAASADATTKADAAKSSSRPSTWTPTAADVGAAPANHSHTAADVGALPTQVGATGQVLGFTAPNTVGAMDAPKGGGGGVYDVVIRTQAEFDALIASPTWLDAVSVCFVGNGGTLKFTRSDEQGCKIPQTVKQIQGVNSATIKVTNFAYNATTNKAALWYGTLPTTGDYWIDGMSVMSCGTAEAQGFSSCTQLTNCTGDAAGGVNNRGIGFYSCTQLINCIGTGGGVNGGGFNSCTQLTNCTGTGVSVHGGGFNFCTQLTNCTGTGDGNFTSFYYCTLLTNCSTSSGNIGFYCCTQLTNCTAFVTATGAANSFGFTSCTQLTNCTGTGAGIGLGPEPDRIGGFGFSSCTQLTNCTGTGTGIGAGNGYGFYSCNYLNGCKQGDSTSTTAFLGGTNTKVDTATVVAS